MSLQELMDQDVTSVARQPQPYGQAPAAIDVITSDEIRRSGATSLPQALRLADNLDVAQLSSSSWDISARGFNTAGFSDMLLVLMDGRSVYSPLLAGVIWNMQDYLLADIDRIEVISGPGGTLWGANAVNGVINIISKNAKDTQGLYVEGGGGSWLQNFGAVRYGGAISSNIFYRVYGKYFDYGPQVYADGTSAGDSWNRGQGGFRIDADASSADTYTLQGDIFGGNTHTEPGGEGMQQDEATIGGGNVLGRWTHTYSDDSDMQLQLYYDRTHLTVPYATFADPFDVNLVAPAGTLIDNLDTVDMDFQHRFPIGQYNNVMWGLGYRFTHDLTQNAPTDAFFPSALDQNLYSGFVQDQIRFPGDIVVTIGTKLEHNDYTGFEYEPSVRAQWNFTDNQMIWGAVSRSVRMPSRFDRDFFEPDPAYFVYLGTSDSSFESETVIAYELGYRARLGSEVSGSLSAFFNDYSHLRSLSYTPGGMFAYLPFYWSNNGKGQTWGFELSADYQIFDWWRLHAGYDFLQENLFHPPTAPPTSDLEGGFENTADPENQVFLRSSMNLPHHMEFDAAGRWIDSAQFNSGAALGTVPGYFELDLRLGWHITKNIEVSVTGQNLLHARHAEAGFPGPTQEQIMRSAYGQVAFTW
ncbi:MAG TPA: TonB-dependent receptor [Verrucomicrobiae bacterium]|nr:TonB-dependent receptor [Verrucomicrobiae bacterium]